MSYYPNQQNTYPQQQQQPYGAPPPPPQQGYPAYNQPPQQPQGGYGGAGGGYDTGYGAQGAGYGGGGGGYAPPPPPLNTGYAPANTGYAAPTTGYAQPNTGYAPPAPAPVGGYAPPAPVGGYGYGQPPTHAAPPPMNHVQQQPMNGYAAPPLPISTYSHNPSAPIYFLRTTIPSPPPATPIQPSAIGYNPQPDIEKLRKATKGFGTDEKVLIEVLGRVDPWQVDCLRRGFEAAVGKELRRVVEKETSGW